MKTNKITKIISTLLIATLGCATIASCSKPNDSDSAASDYSYVSLRINPEVELITDKTGEVLSACAANDDGEVVLSMVTLEGLSVETAAVEFTDMANELGYFDENGESDTVYVGVEGNDELKEKLNKNIRDYFNNNGINGKVSQETLDKFADRAESWDLSTGHVKIVMRVLDAYPELTEEEVLNMSVKEWMELLKADKYVDKIAVSLQADYRAEMQALKAEYDDLFLLRAEMKALNEAYKNASGEEKDALKAQIADIEDDLKPLEKGYKTEADQIRAKYKAASKEARKAYRAEGEKRQKESKDKNKKAA